MRYRALQRRSSQPVSRLAVTLQWY